MDDFKSALSEFEPSLSGPVWNDSLAWLADFKRSTGFDRVLSLPQISDYTQKALSSTRLLAQARLEAPLEDPLSASRRLASLYSRVAELEDMVGLPLPGHCPSAILEDLASTRPAPAAL